MNKPSKYTEELLQFLEDEENYPEMIDWIEEQPELDQPDILREMQAIFKDRYLMALTILKKKSSTKNSTKHYL